MKWTMIDDKFQAVKDGYIITVAVPKQWNGYPRWWIHKDGVEIDACYYHSPPSTKDNRELAAKVQAERALDKILLPGIIPATVASTLNQ